MKLLRGGGAPEHVLASIEGGGGGFVQQFLTALAEHSTRPPSSNG